MISKENISQFSNNNNKNFFYNLNIQIKIYTPSKYVIYLINKNITVVVYSVKTFFRDKNRELEIFAK